MSLKTSPIEQIKKLLEEPSPPHHLIIIGSDRIRRERTLNKLAEGLKLQIDKKWVFDVKKIKLSQAKEQDLKNFIIESSAISFFSKKQIFIIEELEKLTEKQTDLLLELFKSQTNENFYFFLGKQLISNSRLLKPLPKNGLIRLPEYDLGEFRNWVKQEFKARNLLPDSKVIEQITQNSDLSTDIAYQKIDQLELFTDQQQIKLEMLEELFPMEFSPKEYAWLDAITAGNRLQAQKLISLALAEGKEALYLSAILQNNYLNYYLIADGIRRGLTQAQIKGYLKQAPWQFTKQYSIASQKDPKRLIKDLKALVLADSKLKNKSLGSEAIFHELINSLS